jgi:hypothetical protein
MKNIFGVPLQTQSAEFTSTLTMQDIESARKMIEENGKDYQPENAWHPTHGWLIRDGKVTDKYKELLKMQVEDYENQ